MYRLELFFLRVNDQASAYLNNLIKLYILSRNLRSSNQSLFKTPKINSATFGGRSFGYSSPLVWNKLNNYVKQSNSLQIFEGRMNTFFVSQILQLVKLFL